MLCCFGYKRAIFFDEDDNNRHQFTCADFVYQDSAQHKRVNLVRSGNDFVERKFTANCQSTICPSHSIRRECAHCDNENSHVGQIISDFDAHCQSDEETVRQVLTDSKTDRVLDNGSKQDEFDHLENEEEMTHLSPNSDTPTAHCSLGPAIWLDAADWVLVCQPPLSPISKQRDNCSHCTVHRLNIIRC